MTANVNSITIVVAALNEENQVGGAVTAIVEALQRSSFEEYEVLVYNDGSTDQTGDVIDGLAERHECVQAFHHKTPQCIGGVIRSGFGRARMRYAMWVDGKGATPPEALDRIFARCGEADVVVPFPNNQHERPAMRRFVSRCFVTLLNILFGLRLKYYTHCIVFRTTQTRRFAVRTQSYGYQAELLIKLIKSGSSFTQVGVRDKWHFEGRKTKAFKVNNVLGIARFLFWTFWDVRIRNVKRSTPPVQPDVSVKTCCEVASTEPVSE